MAWDSYTKLMLHMNGADGSTVFTDEIGHSFTAYGNAQIDTAQSKFGGASGLFDGTGDYIITANHADWDFGTGDWTIDFWVRRDGAQTNFNGLVCAALSSLSGWVICIYTDGNKPRLVSNASGGWALDIDSNTALADLTWTHLAVVRYGNTVTMYLNGTSVGSRDCTGYTYNSAGTGLTAGRTYTDADTSYFKGWLDEVRISKGIARWTANFTPPTGEYTGINDETGKLQVILAAQGKTDIQTMLETAKLQVVLAAQGEFDGWAFNELGREQVILAVLGEADSYAYNELGLLQVILAAQGKTDIQTMLETAKLQVALAAQGKTDIQTMLETAKLQVLLAAQGETEHLSLGELGKEQVILAVLGEADQYGFIETGKLQVILAQIGISTVFNLQKVRLQGAVRNLPSVRELEAL